MKNEEFNLFSQPPAKKKGPSGEKKRPEQMERIPEELLSKHQDVDSMLKRMHEIRNDIQDKLESAYKKTGITPNTLEQYIEALPEQSHLNEEKIEKLQENAYAATGIKPKISGSRKVVKATKTRQAKTLGSRKKWLPMR